MMAHIVEGRVHEHLDMFRAAVEETLNGFLDTGLYVAREKERTECRTAPIMGRANAVAAMLKVTHGQEDAKASALTPA